MPEVPVQVNGRTYRLACGPGEEDRLIALAADLDKRVTGLVKAFGQVGEGHLLVLASLTLADELADSRTEAGQLRARSEAIEAAADDATKMIEAEAAQAINGLAERIEVIAARLERP
jgi:cell division protein ZapA